MPKTIRERAGLQPGAQVDVRWHDGKIEIEPAPLRIQLVREGPFLVADALEPVDLLTTGHVNDALEQVRRERAGIE